VAEAAACVLLEPGHEGAIYELVGTRGLSQHEVAATCAQILARPVRATGISRRAWASKAAGLSEYARSSLLKMFEYYENNVLTGNPNVLRWLLRREPASLADFCRNLAADHS